MAKRIVKWTLDNSILKLSKPIEDDSKGEVTIDAEFDVAKLFPSFMEMNDVSKQLIIYGCKQKLMDTGASDVGDYQGKVSKAKAKFAELLEGKWTGDRVNSTGAAENKRIATTVKSVIGTVTLQGLMLKKLTKPDDFTEDDQKKLDEFIVLAAKEVKKK